MNIADLSFTIKDDKGEELICDIVSIIPVKENDNETYVVYTAYLLDENDEFITYYGKLIEENNTSFLTPISEDETNHLKSLMDDEIIAYVNEQIQEAIYG